MEELWLRETTRVPPLPIHWHHPSGPHFGNTLALLTFEGRSARVVLERAVRTDTSGEREAGTDLEITEDMSLTDARRVTP